MQHSLMFLADVVNEVFVFDDEESPAAGPLSALSEEKLKLMLFQQVLDSCKA